MESVKAQEVMAAFPEAINTIMVSPIARPKPSTMPAKIPGKAAGNTTRSVVSARVAPSAHEASLKLARHGGKSVFADCVDDRNNREAKSQSCDNGIQPEIEIRINPGSTKQGR